MTSSTRFRNGSTISERLKSWLVEHVRGRHILEIAAGTGYWTEAAAAVAKAITATDYNPEMLAIAAARNLGSNVNLRTADAFALPKFGSPFDAGMAHMWWSHVGKERRQEFLSHFVSRLEPRASDDRSSFWRLQHRLQAG